MPYFRAKAGIPASAAYARTAAYTSFRWAEARGCPGRPRAGSAAAFAEVTPTTLPIKSDTRAISCPILMDPPPVVRLREAAHRSETERDPEAHRRQVLPVELPVGRRPSVRGEHDAPVRPVGVYFRRIAEGEADLQAPTHLPPTVFERLAVQRSDELPVPEVTEAHQRLGTAVLQAGMPDRGLHATGCVLEPVLAAAVEAPIPQLIGHQYLQRFEAHQLASHGAAVQELLAEVGALVIYADPGRLRAAPVVDGDTDDVIGVHEVVGGRRHVELREHPGGHRELPAIRLGANQPDRLPEPDTADARSQVLRAREEVRGEEARLLRVGEQRSEETTSSRLATAGGPQLRERRERREQRRHHHPSGNRGDAQRFHASLLFRVRVGERPTIHSRPVQP